MPTYEYACKACHHEWAVEQRISEAALTECPKCHKQQAERQISGGNFILKGGGWYADLYSSPKAKPNGESKTETTSTESKPTETKSEPKAEPAKPAKSPSTPPKA